MALPLPPPAQEEVVKVLTVVEYPGDEVTLEVVEEYFTPLTPDERRKALQNLLLQGSNALAQEVEAAEEETLPVQGGSLYDNVVFETSFYLDPTGGFLASTSFGRQVNSALPLKVGLEHVRLLLAFLAEEL